MINLPRTIKRTMKEEENAQASERHPKNCDRANRSSHQNISQNAAQAQRAQNHFVIHRSHSITKKATLGGFALVYPSSPRAHAPNDRDASAPRQTTIKNALALNDY